MTDVPEARAPSRWLSAKTIGAAVSLALLAAACGSTATDAVNAAPAPEPAAAGEANPEASSEAATSPEAEAVPEGTVDLSNYPAVVVKDIATGGDLELATVLADGQTPTLLWFWAPH